MKKYFFVSFMIISIHFAFSASRQFDMQFGFGDYAVPGYWTPLFITNGREIGSGSVEIERITQNKISPKEVFPIGKNTVVECPVFIDENISGIVVRLFSGNDLLLERSIDTDKKIFPGHIILTNGMDSRIQQALTHCLFPVEPVITIPMELIDLPSSGLSYDSVSVIVMPDPGNLLTPAQSDALKYWIASGGKLVIFGIRPENESITDELIGGKFLRINDVAAGENSLSMRFGYGKIIGYYQDAENLEFTSDSSGWHDLLEIKPYAHNLRLSSSKSFVSDDNPENIKTDDSFLRSLIFVILLIWSLAFVLFLLIVKRKLLFLSIYTISAIILLIPAGFFLKTVWHGGALYHNRMIVLPANAGLSVDSRIWFPERSKKLRIEKNYSLWGVDADIGVSEKGLLNNWFGKSSLLIHSLFKPAYSLRNGSSGSFEISAYIPNDALEGHFLEDMMKKNEGPFMEIDGINFGNNPHLALAKGNALDIEWMSWDNSAGKWTRQESVPEWLSYARGWIYQLKSSRPGSKWLIGLDRMPGLNLKIQNDLCSLTLWAMPVR